MGAVARGSFGNIYIAVDRSRGSTVVVKRQEMPSDVAARELAYHKRVDILARIRAAVTPARTRAW